MRKQLAIGQINRGRDLFWIEGGQKSESTILQNAAFAKYRILAGVIYFTLHFAFIKTTLNRKFKLEIYNF